MVEFDMPAHTNSWFKGKFKKILGNFCENLNFK